jgi:NAD(P)-dependent dehydrogenase (short-subunit alcohol dehydrogenase family)
LITGGTSGVGRDTALLLARTGAQVVITGRDVERGHAVVDEIAGVGGKGRFVRADLSNGAHWEVGPTAQISEAGFDAIFAVNVKARFS